MDRPRLVWLILDGYTCPEAQPRGAMAFESEQEAKEHLRRYGNGQTILRPALLVPSDEKEDR